MLFLPTSGVHFPLIFCKLHIVSLACVQSLMRTYDMYQPSLTRQIYD